MKIAVFSTRSYDRSSLQSAATQHNHELVFFEYRLTADTAGLANGFPVVCVFINDCVDAQTLQTLKSGGTRLIALRCAGFNNVDLNVAQELGIDVVRVPAYSPYAVAEFAVGLVLMLNRKLHKAYNRVRNDNFILDGLLGFDLNGSTIGVIGTGKIGSIFAQIMKGFNCTILAYDAHPSQEFEAIGQYVSLNELLNASDIISLHCPLTPETHYLINPDTIYQMKDGVMLINTSRGALIDTKAVIEGIKSGKIGYLGIDVYELEAEIFFRDLSDTIIQDDDFQLLQSFPNVVITAHQAFFTRNALQNIAETTMSNITDIEQNQECPNLVKAS